MRVAAQPRSALPALTSRITLISGLPLRRFAYSLIHFRRRRPSETRSTASPKAASSSGKYCALAITRTFALTAFSPPARSERSEPQPANRATASSGMRGLEVMRRPYERALDPTTEQSLHLTSESWGQPCPPRGSAPRRNASAAARATLLERLPIGVVALLFLADTAVGDRPDRTPAPRPEQVSHACEPRR